MKITIAKTAGFCMGVRRAVDMVLDAANRTNAPICTYGPLIHNPQVLGMLKEKGIPVMDKIPASGLGTVLVRAHGVPPESQIALKTAGFEVINATCPRVIRVQTIIRKHAEKGFATIIIGDKDHPEVKGLMGYAQDKGYTVSSMKELKEMPRFDQAVVVAQTTQDTSFFNNVKTWAEEECPHYKVFDTICDSTEKRQAEVRRIAKTHDAIVVVGGKESGNTKRLAQIAAETGRFSIHIEEVSELTSNEWEKLAAMDAIAITAGASTPNWIINQTYLALEDHLQQHKKGAFMMGAGRKLRDFLLRTNLFLALGAASLTTACTTLQHINDALFTHALIAMLYVLSMQIMNNLFSISSDRYNNPARATFYNEYKWGLTSAAVISGTAGLFLSFSMGLLPFLLLMIMSLLGLLYNQPLFRLSLKGLGSRKITKLKDIPGSKTVLIAAAWGTVTSLLPALAEVEGKTPWAFLFPFLFTMGLLFSRTAFCELLEVQGDRITGKETLPITLGEKRSQRLIRNSLYTAAMILFVAALFGWISRIGLIIALIPLSMYHVIRTHAKGKLLPGMHLEFIMECHFLISGLIVFPFI